MIGGGHRVDSYLGDLDVDLRLIGVIQLCSCLGYLDDRYDLDVDLRFIDVILGIRTS